MYRICSTLGCLPWIFLSHHSGSISSQMFQPASLSGIIIVGRWVFVLFKVIFLISSISLANRAKEVVGSSNLAIFGKHVSKPISQAEQVLIPRWQQAPRDDSSPSVKLMTSSRMLNLRCSMHRSRNEKLATVKIPMYTVLEATRSVCFTLLYWW